MPAEKNQLWWYEGMHRVKRLMLVPWTYDIPDLSMIGGVKKEPRAKPQPLAMPTKPVEVTSKPEQMPEFNNQPTLF